jgi:hypothetical protein
MRDGPCDVVKLARALEEASETLRQIARPDWTRPGYAVELARDARKQAKRTLEEVGGE